MLLLDSKDRAVRVKPCPFVFGSGLPEDRYAELAAAFPAYDDQRSYAAEFMDDHALPKVWRDFWEEHFSPAFVRRVIDFWRLHLAKRRLSVLSRDPEKSFIRGCGEGDFEINGQFVSRAVDDKKSVKGMAAHLDEARSVVIFLWYFRHPADKSQGGDFYLAKAKSPVPAGPGRVRVEECEIQEVIPYAVNQCVMVLNGRDAVHGVTPRRKADLVHPRRNVNLTIELPVNP